jgi:hypothetical protein
MKLARTNLEAHLAMDLAPCACGETRFARQSAVLRRGDDLCSRYTGACAKCGAAREFVFRIPEEILHPIPGEVRYGGAEPSELLDPGEWLAVADLHAKRSTRGDLAIAIAAMEEILKFAAPGAERVPEAAFTSERGRAVLATEPGRFRIARLEIVLKTYRDLLRKYDAAN